MSNRKDNNEDDEKIILESDLYDRQYLDDDHMKENKVPSSSKSKKKKKLKKKKKKNLLFFLKWFTILCVLSLFLIGVVGAGFAYSWINDSEGLDLSKFEYIEPSSVLDKNGDFDQELQGKEKREIIDIDEIPDMVKNAFIDIEDERFYTHSGIDIRGLFRAGVGIVTSQSLSGPGGSTITQQLVKLTHLSSEKKVERKVVEMYLAMQLERQFTKDQILEAYLNKVGFANAWGIQAASKVYFDKSVDELSVSQAAVLASIIKSPTHYKPYITEEVEEGVYAIKKDDDGVIVHNENNKNRALAVVQKMKELGHITDEEFDTATEELKNNDFALQVPPNAEIYSFFTDELYIKILDDLMISENFSFDTREDAENYLLNSGLKIHSTKDPNVQNVLDEKFNDDSLFPKQSNTAKRASEALTKELGQEVNLLPEAAMTVIDNSNGHVVGMIGGRNKEKSRSLNRATQKFQVGSSTKPLTVYAPGLETKKITLATTYDDVPIQIGSWKPTNAGGYNGMTTLREGLRKSTNTLAVQSWMDIGLQDTIKYGELLGLEFVKEDEQASSLALGGYTYGQSTVAMASAFSTFASEGTRNEPILYTHIEDRDGNIVLENKQEKIRVFSEQTAFLITDVLKTAVRGGTTSLSVPNMQIAGKTGTTNNHMHAYFTGYTPYYTAAVWYGYDQNKVKVGGKEYNLNIGLSGGSRPIGPAPMWQAVMRDIHKGLKSKNLPGKPGGIVTASIDRVSGKLPTEFTSRDPRGSTIISEMFISGTVPTEHDDFHVELTLCTVSGKLATEFCPHDTVETTVRFIKPDNRFPSGVRPVNPNYVPKSESGVFVPGSQNLEQCDIHSANSVMNIQIFKDNSPISSLSLNEGESTTIQIRGSTINNKNVNNLKDLNVSSNNKNVTVTAKGNDTYTITAVSGGNSTVTAKFAFTDKISYSASISVTINKSEPEPEPQPTPTPQPEDPVSIEPETNNGNKEKEKSNKEKEPE
ncbi:hypothetical protein GC105_11100 [Alkalibaculum sp. M08DMB]|uniref:Penicillin-binding protein 1A n=1 Tax=Alkalibaculum sporogenes TaxID=2655001 RepID=A0A6A7KAC6_9FIRM|nr:transglycosylase domain-containing protein [Alkalibaculum sporogenes]MPW26336.1 hypothetical protein [Alkalibaculum sporogenes]